jgi:hypothetical protein
MNQQPRNTGRRNVVRRNFGSDEVEEQARQDKKQIQLDKEFQQEFGHYFNHRDIRRERQKYEDDPSGYLNALSNDPEILIRDRLEADSRVQRHDLIVRGRWYAQKMKEEYTPEQFITDNDGIQHYKPKNQENIERFNETFEENNRIYESVRTQLENAICDVEFNCIIPNARERKSNIKDGVITVQEAQDTIYTYDRNIKALEKAKNTKEASTGNSRSHDLDKKIDRIKMKKEVINDLVGIKPKDNTFSMEWFERNKHNLSEYEKKYDIEKYRNADYKYDREYQHYFVFIPSGGGKTTLSTKYSRYLADIDDMIGYENNRKKLLFLSGYSQFFNEWEINNNYWQEMFLTYEYKFRNRIILCHGPQMLPRDTITAKNQVLVILPSVKKWGLRFFEDNYKILKELEGNYTKVMLHYRYYFFIIYNFFFMYDEEYKFGVVKLG